MFYWQEFTAHCSGGAAHSAQTQILVYAILAYYNKHVSLALKSTFKLNPNYLVSLANAQEYK